jgi:hypothetical protein
MSINGNG